MMPTRRWPEGELEVYFERRPMPDPKPHEVLVKVLTTPINPSDLGLVARRGRHDKARAGTCDGLPMITADIPPPGMRAMASRSAMRPDRQRRGAASSSRRGSRRGAGLMGKTVALLGGEMCAEHRRLPCPDDDAVARRHRIRSMALPASSTVTSLAFTETMRMEGHSAIVHTAAASNLGQMLVKICAKDNILLVNIVRSAAQVELLKASARRIS